MNLAKCLCIAMPVVLVITVAAAVASSNPPAATIAPPGENCPELVMPATPADKTNSG